MRRRSSTPRGLSGDVAAVFPDRGTAQKAVDDLCAHGADPQLRDALAGSEARVYELDLGAEVRRGVTRGALIGLPVGAVVGLLLVSTAVAGVSGFEALWAGGLPGLIAGLVFGGFAGLVSALWVFEDVDRWMSVHLADDEVLVVARAHGDASAVRRILTSHGGRPAGEVARARPGQRPLPGTLRHPRRA